jgi:dCTP deaminase
MCDTQISELAARYGMISPFYPDGSPPGAISYGLSSYGYDVRLAGSFMEPNTASGSTIDPKAGERMPVVSFERNEPFDLPPHGFVLGHTIEWINMPPDVMAICVGKSTYARCGLIVNVTPLEPGWRGQVTLEISNTASLPVRIYPGEGIAQFVFLRGSTVPNRGYAIRSGTYQNQRGITLPKVRRRP